MLRRRAELLLPKPAAASLPSDDAAPWTSASAAPGEKILLPRPLPMLRRRLHHQSNEKLFA
jgi:hypothetical protein